MILIINFFQAAFTIIPDKSFDLLSLGGGILLISVSLYLTHMIMAHRAIRPIHKSHVAHHETKTHSAPHELD